MLEMYAPCSCLHQGCQFTLSAQVQRRASGKNTFAGTLAGYLLVPGALGGPVLDWTTGLGGGGSECRVQRERGLRGQRGSAAPVALARS